MQDKDEFKNLIKHEKYLREEENALKMGYLREFY